MLLRTTRIVSDPSLPEDLSTDFRQFAVGAMPAMPGWLLSRLWRDIENPHIYYSHSYWQSASYLDAVLSSPARQKAEERAQDHILERLSSANWKLLYPDQRPPSLLDPKTCILREVILKLIPDRKDAALEKILFFIQNVLQQQQGCTQVDLYLHDQHPEEVAVFMLWTSLPLLETWLSSTLSVETREEVLEWLSERPKYRNMRLEYDDPGQPLAKRPLPG